MVAVDAKDGARKWFTNRALTARARAKDT